MAEYIERNEVLDDVRNTMFTMSMCLKKDELDGMRMAQQIIAKKIETFPAADVVPVRHGRWEKATGMMPPEYCGLHICSECGHYAGRKPPYGGKEMLSDYCPNCGARMDKDGDA